MDTGSRWRAPRNDEARWHPLFLANAAFSHSRRAEKEAKLQIDAIYRPQLDFRALDGMFAQPLGSLSRSMRNIITKLLLIVVPRRAAGDG
jgi:hypothetical protein